MTEHPIAQHQGRRESPIILAPGCGVTALYTQMFLALLLGLGLRLLFVFQFPSTSGDSDLYQQLARNLVDHHVYGIWSYGQLGPTDLRMPGYPVFLAGVAMLFGRSLRAISLSQALLDIATCILTAGLAAALAPIGARRRVWLAGLWLAATCPFVANYSAVVLTEVLVTFLTTAALLCFILGMREITKELNSQSRSPRFAPLTYSMLGACLTGVATLVRPEMPLLMAVALAVYGLRWYGSFSLQKLILNGLAMSGVFLLPLAPWAVRNFETLREVQVLSPRYATMPGEYAPLGYYAWTKTWMERFRDAYDSVWAIGEDPMSIEDAPPTAFDSPQEKARVAALFDDYDRDPNLDITPEMDRQFAEIAAERTRRHPLRTYLTVPFQRALTIWFTPRTELVPIDGKLWPLRDQWQDSHADVLTTAGLGALGYLYVALAIAGVGFAWRARLASLEPSHEDAPNLWGISLIVAYLAARTAFLTTVEAPEPRYVVSCYPAVLALVALLLAGRWRRGSRDTNRA